MSVPPSSDPSPPAPDGAAAAPAVRGEAGQLGLLFGALYLIQGLGEPTDGLVAQPIRSLLESWHCSPKHIGLFMAILSLPWTWKPVYGLLTDFVPLGGSRRRNYLLAATAITVIGLLAAAAVPLNADSYWWLLGVLLMSSVGIAFSDVVTDALMVEKGQPRGLTGWLQSIQWTAMYVAIALVGIAGGYLSEHRLHRMGLLVCGGASLVTLLLAVFCVHEETQRAPRTGFRAACRELYDAARQPAVWGVGVFLFLWNFNPFSTTVLQLHMTSALGLSEQFYGNTVTVTALSQIAASACYGCYCRRLPFPLLVHLSIVMGIISTVAYWGLAGERSAIVISLAIGFAYMTANLIQLDFAARVCPPHSAGTVFALLMALSNAGLSLSVVVGSYLYGWGMAWWDARGSFDFLVLVGALTTAGCWLLIPVLRPHWGREGAAGG